MWFLLGVVGILVVIMLAALVSDLRRQAQLRALDDDTPRGAVDEAARRGRAGTDVSNGPVTGKLTYGYGDPGT